MFNIRVMSAKCLHTSACVEEQRVLGRRLVGLLIAQLLMELSGSPLDGPPGSTSSTQTLRGMLTRCAPFALFTLNPQCMDPHLLPVHPPEHQREMTRVCARAQLCCALAADLSLSRRSAHLCSTADSVIPAAPAHTTHPLPPLEPGHSAVRRPPCCRMLLCSKPPDPNSSTTDKLP
jgi:hypothetical protein